MKEMERISSTPARLKEAMATAGKKQLQVAKETGLSHSTISRYLSGKVEPRQEAVIKLAQVLGVSEWWLYGYNVPMGRTVEQKKNDEIVVAIAKMRSDPEFLEVVTQLSDLQPEEYASIKQLISALRNKK